MGEGEKLGGLLGLGVRGAKLSHNQTTATLLAEYLPTRDVGLGAVLM